MRILVVDDDEDFRDLTEGALLSAGYTDIVTAASGWDALKILDVGSSAAADPTVDVVLLDILMPEMDGTEVCARIRNDPRYVDLPIIMVTALHDVDSLANAFVAGATDYLTKPVNRIELVARVRAALRLKAELDRRQARERELLAFLSSWGDRRASIWIDEATGLFVGEVAETYLTACSSDPDEVISVLALTLDRFDVDRSATGKPEERGVLARVARAVRRLAATVGIVAAAYRNGMIILVAPELGADSARELAETLRATVQKLRLPNSESIASDYVTASVAAITGRAERDVDRIQLLTQVISSVQQAAAAGGDRVIALSLDGALPKSGGRVSQNLMRNKEIGAMA
jgi:PleD family two-component response regulator